MNPGFEPGIPAFRASRLCLSVIHLSAIWPEHLDSNQRMSVSKTDALTYLAMLQFGGKSEIRTQGAVTPDSFQDCCLKPLGQLSIYGGRYRDRTYATFRLYTLAGCCITTLPTFLNLVTTLGFEPKTPCSQSRCSTRLSYAV